MFTAICKGDMPAISRKQPIDGFPIWNSHLTVSSRDLPACIQTPVQTIEP